jgi:hypothetical protein
MSAIRTDLQELSNVTTPILEGAYRLAQRAKVNPREIKKRALGISLILLIGLVGTAVTLIAIAVGLPKTEPARLLTIFLMLGSVVMVLASGVAMVMLVWNAYVYQYIKSLEAKHEAIETTDQIHELAEAVRNMSQDVNLEREIVEIVIEEVCSAFPNRGAIISRKTITPIVNLSVVQPLDVTNVCETLTRRVIFREKMDKAMRGYFSRDPHIDLIVREA